MEEASSKLKKFLILFIVCVVILKNASMAGFFEAKSHKGRGFYVEVPEGWRKAKQKKDAVYPDGVEVVMFIPKGINLDYEDTDVYITIFTKKLESALWIEDEMPYIIRSIWQAGNKIMDKGQIKIDGVIAEWVVYHDKKAPALVLEFYMVTENNFFFKIQYSADPDKFNKQRKSFEELKASWKFRF